MSDLISGAGIRSRSVIIGVGIAIALIGVVQLRSAPVDVYPEYQSTTVVVQTEAVGLSAAEVERLVAVPLEELLAPTPLLEEIRSDSVPGLSLSSSSSSRVSTTSSPANSSKKAWVLFSRCPTSPSHR